MAHENEEEGMSLRTIILFVIFVPVIGYLAYFGYQKSTRAEGLMAECAQQCVEEGHLGHSFQWPFFSGPRCECIDE